MKIKSAFYKWRSRFALMRVGNAIGVLFFGICDHGLIWLGLEMRSVFCFGDRRSRFDLVGVGNCDRGFVWNCDRALIWLGLEMRSGLGFGDLRSRFDLVRVGIAIGGWVGIAIALLGKITINFLTM